MQNNRTERAYENGEVSAAERDALAKAGQYRDPEPVGEEVA